MPALIPQRPKQCKFNLRPEEMDGLSYYLLSGCARETAFLKFIRPDFIGSKAQAAVKAAVTQFFAMKDVKDYLAAYKQTIDDLLSPPRDSVKQTSRNIEERKAMAKSKLVEFAMDLANNIDSASDPEFVLKIADKAGLLEQGDKIEEAPRRYIPVTCGECVYRKFVEENCEEVDSGMEIEEND